MGQTNIQTDPQHDDAQNSTRSRVVSGSKWQVNGFVKHSTLWNWKVWFSNRRAKWRREEKLRSQRRDIDSGNALDVAGFGVASRFNITPAGAPGFNVSSCNMYPGPALVQQPLVSVPATAADPYRYHELAFVIACCLLPVLLMGQICVACRRPSISHPSSVVRPVVISRKVTHTVTIWNTIYTVSGKGTDSIVAVIRQI